MPPRAGCAGERVRVGNERGSFEALLAVGDAARPGVVATTKGHWPKPLAGGTNINAATEERDADLGGGAVFRDCSVWVEPVAANGGARRRAYGRPCRSSDAAALGRRRAGRDRPGRTYAARAGGWARPRGPRARASAATNPRSGKVSLRGIGVRFRVDRLDYWDGEPG